MKITVLCVGNLKEKYLKDAILEYQKRIKKYVDFEIIEIMDESNKEDEVVVKNKEAQRILAKLPKNCYKVALELKGEMLDSIALAKKIENIFTYQNSHLCFLIGGSYGFSKDVLDVVDYKLCFSKMTFPHQLIRVFLLEQIYRSFKIINNETYHK